MAQGRQSTRTWKCGASRLVLLGRVSIAYQLEAPSGCAKGSVPLWDGNSCRLKAHQPGGLPLAGLK
jgi:hypothetical protein